MNTICVWYVPKNFEIIIILTQWEHLTQKLTDISVNQFPLRILF